MTGNSLIPAPQFSEATGNNSKKEEDPMKEQKSQTSAFLGRIPDFPEQCVGKDGL